MESLEAGQRRTICHTVAHAVERALGTDGMLTASVSLTGPVCEPLTEGELLLSIDSRLSQTPSADTRREVRDQALPQPAWSDSAPAVRSS